MTYTYHRISDPIIQKWIQSEPRYRDVLDSVANLAHKIRRSDWRIMNVTPEIDMVNRSVWSHQVRFQALVYSEYWMREVEVEAYITSELLMTPWDGLDNYLTRQIIEEFEWFETTSIERSLGIEPRTSTLRKGRD